MKIKKEILEKIYFQILNERPLLNRVDYQEEWLLNPESYTHPNNVLAFSPAGGKTNTIIIYLEILHRLGILGKTLLFSAAESLLKRNMKMSLEEFNPSFSFIIVNATDDIERGNEDNVDVFVSLPQMFTERNKNNSKLLPKIELLITDEAHIWFLKNTIQTFIKEQKIEKFVELTGSPYIFNLANDIAKEKGVEATYRIHYVTTNDLLIRNRIKNVNLQMITTPAYNFSNKSFIGGTAKGNLIGNQTKGKVKNRYALIDVLNEMLEKCNYNCKIPTIKNKTNLGAVSKAWHAVGKLFDSMGQTIITTDSIEMCDEFYKVFSENGLDNKLLKSHSECDPNSKNFELFEAEPIKYKILIVVDRGQLGYNYLELFNIVDFTFSTNIIKLHQLLNRVTRQSKLNPNKDKIFFKVATNELEGWYKVVMTVVLHLCEKNWYERYNTKNLGQLPLTLIRKKKTKTQIKSNKPKRKSKINTKNFDDLELLNLESFNGILHNPDGVFETYAETTLDKVYREFFNIKGYNGYTKGDVVNYEEGKVIVAPLKLGSYAEWTKFTKTDEFKNNSIYQKLPIGLIGHYGQTNEWLSSGDFFGYNPHHGSNWVSFDEFKQFMLDNHLSNRKQFGEFCKQGKRPNNIPSNPHMIYDEWQGWDYLFKDKIVYTESQIVKEFKDCNNRSEADRKNTQMFYQMSEELKNKIFGLLPKDIHYNIEDILKEACEFGSEFQWKKNSKIIYPKAIHNKNMAAYANNNNLMNEIRNNINVKIAWALNTITNKELADLAKTFKTKGEFTDKHDRLLRMAKRRGIWNKISSHMVSTLKYWTLDRFNEIIKEHNLTNKQQLRTFKGANLRKVAYELNLWDTFPNAKKGNSANNLILI